MPDRRRTVFFVSDGTGITVEMLGHSLLTQFDGIESTHETIPFVDSVAKAGACVERINRAPRPAGFRPVVFTTLVNAEIRETVSKADAFVLDLFQSFLVPLEAELGSKSTHTIGRSHSARDAKGYTHRIDAINFALAHDDGASSRDLDKADVILVGREKAALDKTANEIRAFGRQVFAIQGDVSIPEECERICQRALAEFAGVLDAQPDTSRNHDATPSAAASLREGMEELFTINRLGLPPTLRRCLATTNIMESPNAGVRLRTGRVTRWKDGAMVLRWAATAFLSTEQQFRRLMGYRDLWALKAVLDDDVTQATKEAAA